MYRHIGMILAFLLFIQSGSSADDPVKELSGDLLDAAVQSYEHLATAIIEVRKTEDSVVLSILAAHHRAAQTHLDAAAAGKHAGKNLEAAAEEITHLANEGDKRVQAVRQRLKKAGHTHNSDADTKEDYLYINSKEKKALLASAKAIAQLGEKGTPEQIHSAAKTLAADFKKAVTPE